MHHDDKVRNPNLTPDPSYTGEPVGTPDDTGDWRGTGIRPDTETGMFADSKHSNKRVLSAGSLAGDRVRNNMGEDLGKIEEIMIDVHTGRVAYAVLSFGGFLGMGNKLFAVPWQALTVDLDEKEFVLDVPRETLENAPGFDKDDWPDMANPDWGAQIHGHYGRTPYWVENDDKGVNLDRRMEEVGTKRNVSEPRGNLKR
jgi:sporulation protein YlmC with PRC-barrel domain